MRALVIIAVGIALLSPRPVAADSDGYYCTGNGYLAWETRGLDRPGGHMLHIVRFSAAGIERASPVALEDFQVHGMRCDERRVELRGGGRTVSVDLRTGAVESGAGAGPEGSAANLGHWAVPGVVSLDTADGSRYELVVARTSRTLEGGIEHHTLTELVRREDGIEGPVTDGLTIFRGVFLETVD